MTQERITKRFNGSAKLVLDTIRLWLPLILGTLSLITSLYAYKLKAEIKDDIKGLYVSKEDFAYLSKDLDKNSKVVDTINSRFVQKEDWDKIIPVLQQKSVDNEINRAKLGETILNLEKLMKEVRDELKEIRRTPK